MCCKHNLLTIEIKGQKARLNINGRKQIYGVNYYESCVPVVMWFAIQFMITLAIFLVWAMHQIDFMKAYAQAPIVCDMYMEMSPRIETKHGDSKDYILKLLMNLYSQKQAGCIWNQ
jgi:hypothetical protein